MREDFPCAAEDVDGKIRELADATKLSPLTLRVCLLRGLDTAELIREFLSPKLEKLTDPMRIKDMDRAVERLVRARGAGPASDGAGGGELIRVFGDYDVDGTTGGAMLIWMFREFGFRAEIRQPDRFKDGYGLNVAAVEEAHAAGATLLVTVDCGITSFDAADRARELGVDLIVVDHHQIDPKRGLPHGVAIVDPQRADCESGLRQLCGCGLAFYLARALRTRGRELGWWPEGREPNLKQHLDLVVMATAADMVPLTGDNHILVRHGLEVLRHSRKPGVRALMQAAGLGDRDLSPGHLGFVIGPRINASGRVASASLAMDLLTTRDESLAAQLAQELERLNKERMEIQNRIWDEVRVRVEQGIAEGRFQNGIVVADAGWHEGVVGIVASRVTETFRRPAAVIAIREDFAKGSVRSFAGKDVLGALRECASILLGFGGHKHAAGLSVAPERLPELERAFDQALSQMQEDASARPLMLEGECTAADLDFETFRQIEDLGPFGPGNPEPVFTLRARMRDRRVLKGRHLKLKLATGAEGGRTTPGQASVGQSATAAPGPAQGPAQGHHAMTAMTGTLIDAIWFNAAERTDLPEDVLRDEAVWAAVPELNRYQGRATPTLRVRDFRKLD